MNNKQTKLQEQNCEECKNNCQNGCLCKCHKKCDCLCHNKGFSKCWCNCKWQTKPQEQEEWEIEFDELRTQLSYSAPEVIKDKYKFFIRSLLRNQRDEATAELKERVIKYFEEVKNNKEEINLTKKIGIEMWHSSLGWNQAIEKAIEIVKKIK